MASGPATPAADASQPRRRYAPRMPPAERREQLIDAALEVILQHGYAGVSIEAIARTAGVTRPVVYDHFPNLGSLLQALIEREEQYALEQLAQVVPDVPGDAEPAELFAAGVKRFLEAVASRPATWRIILLPLDGTPALVRRHVEQNRGRIQERIEHLVRWAQTRLGIADGADPELVAWAIRSLGEEAGRTVLTDPDRFAPERYEQFVTSIMRSVWRSR